MPNDDKIYKSTDDGHDVPDLGDADRRDVNDWYTSMFAPSDATKVYLAGYRFTGTSEVAAALQEHRRRHDVHADGATGLPPMRDVELDDR